MIESALMTESILLRETPAETIVPLRFSVLRPHRPIDEVRYATDALEGTFHWAAFDGDTLVGCASAHRAPSPMGHAPAYQLRGMAVREEYRSRGLGARILVEIEAGAKARGARYIWCNGRTRAGEFYRRHGWVQEGPEFEIIGIPHFVFVKPL